MPVFVNRNLLQLTAQGENSFYGHLAILSKYCGLTDRPWLNGYLQHGWNGCDGFSNYAGSRRISKKFIWSKRALQDQIKRGGRNSTVIGAPWLYSLKMNGLLAAKTLNKSSKTIAYPLHSQPWAPKNYLHLDYASYLLSEYGEVTVCLHWSEYSNNEITRTYLDKGHDVVTNGVGTPWLEGFDVEFLNKQQALLKDHGRLVTNAMQTSVLYAMSLGLKVEFGGPASWVKKIDEVGTYGEYGQDYWKNRVLSDPENTWQIELGFSDLLNPTDLKQILEWDKSNHLNLKFASTRLIDLLTDGSFVEKLSYFTKGRK
jgi:hypothetical protein